MPTTTYFWDPTTDSVMEEYDGAGTVQATYTRRPEMYGPLVSQYRGGNTSYYHFDALGSTRALTDDSQTVTDSFTYDAWGNEVARTGTTPTPYTWGGQWGYQHSAAIGGHDIRARNYPTSVARWSSVDPLGFGAGDLNLYRYVAGNPVRAVDPTGQDCPGCTFPPLKNANTCQLQCCALHDECYCQNGCTFWSWGHNIFETFWYLWPCARCNTAAEICFSLCAVGIFPGAPTDYFCARQGRYITICNDVNDPRWPCDFLNEDDADAACCGRC